MNLKKSSALIITLAVLAGCSSNPVNNTEIVKPSSNEKTYIAKVSEKSGATFSINIGSNSFQTKSTNGTPAKTVTDIANYKVHLLKKTTTGAYVSGDSPFDDKVNTTAFTIPRVGTSQTITFSNVQPTSGNESYHVMVFATDSGSTDLIKQNNGTIVWGGTSANMRMAVDTTAGVTVTTGLVVSPSTNIPVTLNLNDGIGASIGSDVTVTSGNVPTTLTAN